MLPCSAIEGRMDLQTLEQLLREASARVALGAEHLRQRREVVEALKRSHHDTTTAKEVLRRFEQLHAMDIADLERLEKEREKLRGRLR